MKRTTKNMTFLSVLGLLLAISACTKNFDKINTNPNAPNFVPTAYLLTCAEKGLMDFTWDRWWNASTGMILAEYYAENLYTNESQFFFRTNLTYQYWGYFYGSGLNDQGGGAVTVAGMKSLQTIIDECNATPSKYVASGAINNQKAVATILEVWEYQNLTDTWGDIPFSQALKDVTITQPKYDKQSDIYTGLLAKLDSAIAWIDVSKTDLQGDLIYSGNMSAWLKFANSLKLRVAIRMADVNSTVAKTEIMAAVAGGVFTSNADNALLPYISAGPNYNPLYYDRFVSGRTDFCASNVIVDVMNRLNDPRRPFYFDTIAAGGTNPGGTFVGRPFGQNGSDAGNTQLSSVSQPSGASNQNSTGLSLSATAPGVFLDYAQVQFILAEAVERGYISGTAESYYDAGIQGSFDFWGAPGGAAYIAQDSVGYTALKSAGRTWKSIIGEQKWLALYNQGIQGWIEYRRLDFGILQAPVDGFLVGSAVPVRMQYPYNESQLNPTGYNGAISDQGADVMATKVWWDIN